MQEALLSKEQQPMDSPTTMMGLWLRSETPYMLGQVKNFVLLLMVEQASLVEVSQVEEQSIVLSYKVITFI